MRGLAHGRKGVKAPADKEKQEQGERQPLVKTLLYVGNPAVVQTLFFIVFGSHIASRPRRIKKPEV